MILKFLVLLYFILSCCYCCLPNPPVSSGPIIVIGDMMEPICDPNPCSITGLMVTITENPPNSDCLYTATATCNMAFSEIQFNGVAAPAYSSPQSLICDASTNQYTYTDGGNVQQQINAIQCACQANPCPALTGSMVTISAPVADASCTYTAMAVCDNPYPRVIQYNGGGDVYMSPQTLTCDTATSQFTFVDMGGIVQQITTINCNCDDNPCTIPPLGAMASVSAPTVDAACTYTADAICTPPTFSIQFNSASPLLMSPQTLTCDFGTLQYTYDNAGTPTTVTLIDCICAPNPCPTPPTGVVGPPTATVGTPTVDATCTYTVTAECSIDPMASAYISFNGGPDVPAPQTLTCNPATMQYTYDNAGTPTTATTAACDCAENHGFSDRGPGVSSMTPASPDPTTCIYYSVISCAPMSLMFNTMGVGTPATLPSPQTRRCFATIPTTQTPYEFEITPGVWELIDNIVCGP